MSFVLDASVTLTWLFPNQTTQYSKSILDYLQTGQAFVPMIWQLEISNVALGAERNNRLSHSDILAFFTILEQLPINRKDTGSRLASLFSFALQHGLSAYDAGYLELAFHFGLPIASLDKKIRNAAKSASIELFQP